MILDNSMIGTFQNCPRKFFYRYVIFVEQKNSSASLALMFGKAFHAAVEQDSLENALQAWTTCWNSIVLLPKSPYTIEQGHKLVRWWWNQPKRGTTWLKEMGFVVPLGNILYGGKIDLFERNDFFGGLVVVDYKTTSRVTTQWIEQAVNSKQLRGYVASAHILGYAPKMGLIRVVTVAETKTSSFTQNDIPVQTTDEDIDSWLASTEFQGKWINDCFERNFFPMSGQCGTHYESCPYLTLCLSAKGKQLSQEEVLLNGLFAQAPKWEPWYDGKITLVDQPSLMLLK